ncbi:hypothetical protein HUG17_6886 [Dermatophagoides farinae]|uniref:Uncharacterized protein n=2 Tax=Dermatophagoides farinae TaxID=6954 RepID=A0A9D4NRY1_DERFA|nr:hypothetical protein HUG17_6886 [Dermatophagoides farinae]
MWNFIRQNNYFLFDLYIFLFIFSYGIYILTTGWLIQDKICRNLFNQSRTFCEYINEKDRFDENEIIIRDEILAFGAMFNNYANLIKTLPMFAWSLFVGSFLDRFPNATKILFIWMNIIQIFEYIFNIANAYYFELSPYYLLLVNLTVCLTGGMTTFLAAINRCIVVNSSPEFHAIYFTILHVILVIAPSLGTLIAGSNIHFLDDNEQNTQLRNYNQNFIIMLGISLVSLLMILLIKVERDETMKETIGDSDSEALISPDMNNNISDNTNQSVNGISQRLFTVRETKFGKIRKIIRTFFDFENVRQTYHCFIKPRPIHAREQIFFMVFILFLFLTNMTGIDSIFLQFSQQVYQLDAQEYSFISVYIKILPTIVLLISSYVLINKLQLKDGTMFALTITSGFISQVLIGTFPNLLIFLVAIFIGALFNLATIVIKTKMAKIVAADEAGKIFSMTSTLESLSPTLGALIFSTIFASSISFYPTMCFHIAALITVISLILALFQDVYFKNYDQ